MTGSVFFTAPPFETRHFSDAGEAVAYVRKIYEANTSWLRESFQKMAQGDDISGHVFAAYPYAAIHVHELKKLDTRLAFGFVSKPGRYSTTLTRPDIFANYYFTQFNLLLRNHGIQIEVGVSQTPIPIHFAFPDGMHVEGTLPPDRIDYLRRCFDLPDLALMDDSIANGTYTSGVGQDMPLSLFTAPRVDYSLHRLRHYTGTDPSNFQNYVIFTNYQFYVDEFVRLGENLLSDTPQNSAITSTLQYERLVSPGGSVARGEGALPPCARLPQMPAYHLMRENNNGITMINIGVGPSNARNISDHIAVLRPDAWIMLGHCAGLRENQRLGDYVLAHGYVRDDQVLDDDLPLWVPVPALAEVQRALESAVAHVTGQQGFDIKTVMRTGTVVTTDNRNWEISGYSKLVQRFAQSRAIALDMESAVIAANGFRFRVPYGTLLCVSDRPLHGEIKLPGMANRFYRQQIDQHLQIGVKAMELLCANGLESLHSRKLRGFAETAFQ